MLETTFAAFPRSPRLFVLSVLLLAACQADVDVNGDFGSGPAPCSLGVPQSCACPAGQTSTQICNADGLSFSPCECGQNGLAGAANGGAGSTSVAGTTGAAGTTGVAGTTGTAGVTGSAGGSGTAGTAGTSGLDAGTDAGGGQDAATGPDPEPGRLAGITAAHNAVRAGVTNPTPSPALPPLTWSTSIAATAQAYADQLASSGCNLVHSGANGLGENLAWYGGQMATPEDVVDGWASEVDCWTYGKFMNGDACDSVCVAQHNSNGCGHYTQVVWRNTTELGCGMATCSGGAEIWVCNYKAQGNYINQYPY